MRVIKQIRTFNRFYTNFLGLLNNHILDSPYSLSESRIIYELSQREIIPANELVAALQIDKGYLSRILKKFEKEQLIRKSPAPDDKRVQNIRLTARGRSLYQYINSQSEKQIEERTRHLAEDDKNTLAGLLSAVLDLLSPSTQPDLSLEDITIRTSLQPGDMGFVILSHGGMYQKEYHYGIPFERYVAQGLLEFYEKFDPQRSRVWVCEHYGQKMGFLVLMDRGKAAQLRYFFVGPRYRGIGLGKKLMDLYMDCLREMGYVSSYLWTTDEQKAAASLYRRYGFRLSEEKPSTHFGKAVIEQKYELTL